MLVIDCVLLALALIAMLAISGDYQVPSREDKKPFFTSVHFKVLLFLFCLVSLIYYQILTSSYPAYQELENIKQAQYWK